MRGAQFKKVKSYKIKASARNLFKKKAQKNH
jgi:hypothetical protein